MMYRLNNVYSSLINASASSFQPTTTISAWRSHDAQQNKMFWLSYYRYVWMFSENGFWDHWPWCWRVWSLPCHACWCPLVERWGSSSHGGDSQTQPSCDTLAWSCSPGVGEASGEVLWNPRLCCGGWTHKISFHPKWCSCWQSGDSSVGKWLGPYEGHKPHR